MCLLQLPSWPEEHAHKVTLLLEELALRTNLVSTRLSWATGIVLVVKTA